MLLSLLLFFFSCSKESTSSEDGTKFQGTIYDADGPVVTEIMVTDILSKSSFTIQSDQSGNFEFTIGQDTRIKIAILKRPYLPYSDELIATIDTTLNIQLDKMDLYPLMQNSYWKYRYQYIQTHPFDTGPLVSRYFDIEKTLVDSSENELQFEIRRSGIIIYRPQDPQIPRDTVQVDTTFFHYETKSQYTVFDTFFNVPYIGQRALYPDDASDYDTIEFGDCSRGYSDFCVLINTQEAGGNSRITFGNNVGLISYSTSWNIHGSSQTNISLVEFISRNP